MAGIAWIPAGVALWLVVPSAQGPDLPPASSKMVSLLKSKLEAAQKAFQAIRDDDRGDPEVAYRWSCRWLEAERALSDTAEKRIAALQAHLERVRKIAEATNRLFEQRFV